MFCTVYYSIADGKMVPYRHELQKHGIIQYIHSFRSCLSSPLPGRLRPRGRWEEAPRPDAHSCGGRCCTSFFEFIPLFHPHIFIANVASIPLWIKTNLRRVAQRQSTVGLNSPSIFICCSFCGSKQSFPKSLPHITPDFPHLAVFQQIKHLKDNSSRQNPFVIVGFLGCPYAVVK